MTPNADRRSRLAFPSCALLMAGFVDVVAFTIISMVDMALCPPLLGGTRRTHGSLPVPVWHGLET